MSILERHVRNGIVNKKVDIINPLHSPPETPPHLFQLHCIAGFIGNTGSGKTNAVTLLTREYLNRDVFSHIYLITPTFDQNDAWQAIPEIDRENVYTDPMEAQAAVKDITRKVKEASEAWETSKSLKSIWRKWIKKREDPDKMEQDEIAILDSIGYVEPVELDKPCPLLLIDDMSHTNLFQDSKKNPFINLCLRHRHLHDVGITIFICVQNYRAGITRSLRSNMRVFFIFPTKDQTQLEDIYREIAECVTKEDFLALYHQAVDGQEHSFLTIDKEPICDNAGMKKLLRFRRNFDTYLTPSSLL